MPRSDHEAKWVKFGNIREFIFLNDDVVAIASGIHVLFLNLTTREENIEKFDNAERGIGASCLAGHPAVPMFATAERRSRPKIFIFTYPGIRKVSTCVLEDGPNNYLASVFAGTEYLLALTAFPDFKIVLWLWRTGELMTEIDTTIVDHEQRIACSLSSPYLISQIGKTSKKMSVYEVNVCSRIVTIAPIISTSSTTNMENTVCSSWASDGNWFHCDATGNVSLLSSDGKRCILVVREENNTVTSNGSPLIEAFGIGVIVVNRQSQISFYRRPMTDIRVKSASPWRSVWVIQATSHPVAVAKCPHKDSLVFCGKRGEVFQVCIENDIPRLRIISHHGANYEFLNAINPRCDHIVAIDEHDRLSIFQCLTGQSVGSMGLKIHGRVRSVASHPTLPIIATSTSVGKCVIVNAVHLTEPSIVQIIHLQRDSLDGIRYSFSGSQLGAVDIFRDKLFMIGGRDNEEYSVLGLLDAPMKIINFLIYENDEITSKIVILSKTSKSLNCGRNIAVYSFNRSKGNGQSESVIELTNMLNSLMYGRSRHEIIVVPYLTKQLHVIQIQEDYQGLTLTEAFSSGHQLRNIDISLNSNFLVTCGYDGLIIIRSRKKAHQVLSIIMSHHRLDGGAKFVMSSAANTIMISLGRNGDLIAMSISNLEPFLNAATLDEPTLSITKSKINPEDDDLTWVEQKAAVKLQNEREQCAAVRNSLKKDFSQLQQRLKALLDANEQESPNAQLSISDFELDRSSRDKKIRDNVFNQKELMNNLEEKMFQQDRVTKYLREMCWDSMEITFCSLTSINGNLKVENFSVPYILKEQQDRLKWKSFDLEFNKPFMNNETKLNDQSVPKNLLIIGTTTHRWIADKPAGLANQIRKFSGYTEGIRESVVIRGQERKLKVYFNKLFQDMRAVKERELELAAQRIEEIERCSLELKNTFNIDRTNDDDSLVQPLWHYTEKPETIVTVTDSEILSGQAATFLERDNSLELLRKQIEESLKLNDSFREEALMLMMDGLLEVRWEDEIKKDPPKPLCLSYDHTNFTAEEIEEIEIYNMKCEYLSKERHKYKNQLMDRITIVKEALRAGVDAFDQKLNNFYLDRMKIESAVFQETLMRLRESQRRLSRRRGMEAMQEAHDDLSSAIKEYRNLNEISNTLEAVVSDTKNRYENLVKRDKLLETKLRGEFPDLKQPMVEHLLRHYRKRPKNVQLTCTSITYLTEISKCVVSGDKSEILPRDCLEFLRGMDNLDVMPNNLPVQIDANHWSLLCKLRRAKVELEIKITSCAVDLAEAEQTFISHQRACSNAEHRISQLKEVARERDAQQFEATEDMQVQLVLMMGQIETRLYGDPNELCNAVLVPFSMVERANNAILSAGRKKLAAMRKTVEYRRTILWREWRHECMRITLEDMREELKVLQGVKVTKEVQHYLFSQSVDAETEINGKTCERILLSTKERYRRIFEEKRAQSIDAAKKITVWSKQNKKLVMVNEKMKLTSFKASMLVHDETRERDSAYRRNKLKSIMKRTRLTKKIHDNYNELMALHTQLELLRLKTYPTLRLKGRFAREKPITKSRSN